MSSPPAAPGEPLWLWCLPCAGGSATAYLRWRKSLRRALQVEAIELPGRGLRLTEPFVEDFGALVDTLARDHAPPADGRYALFGHSMGGLLAHALAQRFAALGRPPVALIVAACGAPAERDARRFAVPHDDAGIEAELRRQGGTPAAVFEHPELLHMAVRALRADYRVCASYARPRAAPVPFDLHAWGGRRDAVGTRAVEGWRDEAGGRFALRWFDGGHFFLREQEGAVLDALVQVLGPSASFD